MVVIFGGVECGVALIDFGCVLFVQSRRDRESIQDLQGSICNVVIPTREKIRDFVHGEKDSFARGVLEETGQKPEELQEPLEHIRRNLQVIHRLGSFP